MKRYIIAYLVMQAVLLISAVPQAVASPVVPTRGDRSVYLIPYIEILEDIDNRLTINDMLDSSVIKKFSRARSEYTKYGYIDSFFWMRFTIDPSGFQGADREDYFIELAYPLYDLVEVYIFDSQGGLQLMRGGDDLPFSNRKIMHRNFLFPVSVVPDIRQTVYIHIKSTGSFQLPFNLVRKDYFIEKEQAILLAFGFFYGILIIIGLASLFIFFIEMDRLYLYYAAFVASIILWHSSLDGFAFQYLWPQFPWWADRCIIFFIIALAVTTINLTRTYLSMKTITPVFDRVLWYMQLIIMVVSPAFLFIPYTIGIKIATLYSAGLAAMLLLTGIYFFIKGNRLARYFSAALGLFLFGSIVLALNRYGFIHRNLLTDQAQRIGSIIQVMILYFALGERISIIKREKRDAQHDAAKAEEKYEIIVEESSDMIFSLDENWNFLSSNKAAANHLKIPKDDIARTNLLALIHEENENNRKESVQLIMSKLEEFKSRKEPLSFRAFFRSSIGGEPVAMNVSLEYISVKGKKEILGRASRVAEDSLLRYFVEEKQKYVIENYILTADEVTQRLTRNLARYMKAKEVNMVSIALREIIINAIEHGNLGLTFEEKSAAISSGQYFSLIEKRRSDPDYSGRKVVIECQIDDREARYVVTDEGQGFDHATIIEKNRSDGGPGLVTHGRGVLMTMNVFDRVDYNRKGNRVTMVKSFKMSD